jgi:hypothetical protein
VRRPFRPAIGARTATLAVGVLAASLLLATTASAGSGAAPATTPAQAKKLCTGIPPSAVKPLYKGKVRGALAGTGGATCQFEPAGSGVPNGTLFVQLAVGFGPLWAQYSAGAYRIAGVGTKAAYIWSKSEPRAPGLVAEKGDLDCYVTTNGYVDHTSVAYTTSGGNPVVSKAHAAAWAKKLGAVCNAVFSGK